MKRCTVVAVLLMLSASSVGCNRSGVVWERQVMETPSLADVSDVVEAKVATMDGYSEEINRCLEEIGDTASDLGVAEKFTEPIVEAKSANNSLRQTGTELRAEARAVVKAKQKEVDRLAAAKNDSDSANERLVKENAALNAKSRTVTYLGLGALVVGGLILAIAGGFIAWKVSPKAGYKMVGVGLGISILATTFIVYFDKIALVGLWAIVIGVVGTGVYVGYTLWKMWKLGKLVVYFFRIAQLFKDELKSALDDKQLKKVLEVLKRGIPSEYQDEYELLVKDEMTLKEAEAAIAAQATASKT